MLCSPNSSLFLARGSECRRLIETLFVHGPTEVAAMTVRDPQAEPVVPDYAPEFNRVLIPLIAQIRKRKTAKGKMVHPEAKLIEEFRRGVQRFFAPELWHHGFDESCFAAQNLTNDQKAFELKITPSTLNKWKSGASLGFDLFITSLAEMMHLLAWSNMPPLSRPDLAVAGYSAAVVAATKLLHQVQPTALRILPLHRWEFEVLLWLHRQGSQVFALDSGDQAAAHHLCRLVQAASTRRLEWERDHLNRLSLRDDIDAISVLDPPKVRQVFNTLGEAWRITLRCVPYKWSV